MSDTIADSESSPVLLQRAQAGDAAALARLLQRYLPALRRWINWRLPGLATGPAVGDDLIEDAVVQAIRTAADRGPASAGAVGAYLREAVMRRSIELYRRGGSPRLSATPAAVVEQFGSSPLQEAIGADALQRYEGAMQQLSPADRELVVMRLELGRGYDEIALALGGMSPAQARVAVAQSLARLARGMAGR